MDMGFLPNILILVFFFLVSTLVLFIPRHGRVLSYYTIILGHTSFIGSLYMIDSARLTDIFEFSKERIDFIKLIGLLTVFAVFLNGHTDSRKIRNSLCSFVFYLSSIFLTGASEFIGLYLALQMINLSMCSSIIFSQIEHSRSAAVKFYIQHLIFSAIFLLGIVFFYGSTGSLDFRDFNINNQLLYFLSIAFFLAYVFFNIGCFPFHFWKRNVYSNISGGNILIVFSANKIVCTYVFITLLKKLIFECSPDYQSVFFQGIVIVAIINCFLGNIVALVQKRIKHILTYTSLYHIGFILIILKINPDNDTGSPLIFYLVFYTFCQTGAFLAINTFTKENDDDLRLLKGGFHTNRISSVFLIIFILALAGTPLTVGFYMRYILFFNYFESGFVRESIIIISSSIIAPFCYGKIILPLFTKGNQDEIVRNPRVDIVQFVLAVLVLIGGIWPAVFLR